MALFESYERRIDQINAALAKFDIKSIEEAKAICDEKGIDVYEIVKSTQPICFENACWAYTVGAAMAIKNGDVKAVDAAKTIGVGLQSFCIPGSVADDRKVGLGHGNLGSMLLDEGTECFAFLAGHESFAAAEGAIKIAEKANKVRTKPLRVILNGLGKDAAKIISRINGFTYVETQFDYFTGEVKVLSTTAYSDGPRAKVNCYGADDVREGVAIMHKEGVDVSITGNSTNPTRFQHPVAGTYKKECIEQGKKYYDALKSVHDLVKDARKVQQTILLVGDISELYVTNYQKMLSDPNFTPAELDAIAFGYTKLLEESNGLLVELKTVVSANGLSMSDKERMDIIDRVYRDLKEYRNLVAYYTNQNIAVSYLRAKEKNDTKRILSLYGNADERYW